MPGHKKNIPEKADSLETIVYMLLSLEAKLNAQAQLLIEITDILTRKDPGQVEKEYTKKCIEEHREVLRKMIEDKNVIQSIKNML